MKTSLRYECLLDEHGITLVEDFGVADVALKLEYALLAIEFLKEDGIPILGGDVFFQVGNALELAYANWFTKQRADEDFDDFIKRTYSESLDYITTFPPKMNATPLFALVVGEL
jgi:hypothetical protein